MEPLLEFTEHGRVLKKSLSWTNSLDKTFGKYAKFATLKGKLIRWYSETDMGLLSPEDRKCLFVIGVDVYNIKGFCPNILTLYTRDVPLTYLRHLHR